MDTPDLKDVNSGCKTNMFYLYAAITRVNIFLDRNMSTFRKKNMF